MQTLGELFKEKRLNLGMDEREFGHLVGIGPSRIREIELDCHLEPHQVPSQLVLKGVAQALKLDDSEKELMFELVEKLKKNNTQTVTPLLDYIHTNEGVRDALKIAREFGATKEDWEEFAKKIKNRDTRREF